MLFKGAIFISYIIHAAFFKALDSNFEVIEAVQHCAEYVLVLKYCCDWSV